MAFGNLTIDFKSLTKIPIRDRATLASSSFASEIFGNLTPSQIAALFPDYYKQQLNAMAGQSSSFGGTVGALSTVSASSGVNTSTSASGGSSTAIPTTNTSAPATPEYVTAILQKAGIPTEVQTQGEIKTNSENGNIVKVLEAGAGYNVVQYENGRVERRNGDYNWRNNNPGNMLYDSTVAKFGGMQAPGSRFAVFPSLEAGQAAQSYKLFEREDGVINSNLTLRQQIYKWAPPEDNNDTEKYLKTILDKIGHQYENTKGKDIPPELRDDILKTMRQVEGFKAGKIDTIQEATKTIEKGQLGGTAPVDQTKPTSDTEIMPLRKSDGSFDTSVFDKVDPRLKQYWNTATDSEKRRLELALEKLGVQGTQDVMSKYPKTSEATAVTLLENRVDQQQATLAGTRNLPLQPELVDTMSYAAQKVSEETGRNIHFKTFSGGQAKIGTAGPRTGSTEHDLGGAADSYFIETLPDGTERRLSLANPADKALMYRTAYHFARAGGRSVGLESGYMGDEAIHLGISRNNEDPTHHADRELSAIVDQGKKEFIQEAKTKGWDTHYGYRNFIEEYKKSQKATADIAPTTPATAPITDTPKVDATGSDAQPMNLRQPEQTTAVPAEPSGTTNVPSANSAWKLGGTEELGVTNKVDEPYTLSGPEGEMKFNADEEVNVKDGRAEVKNEYKKATEETQQKTDTGPVINNKDEKPIQNEMKMTSGNSMPKNPWADKLAEGFSPHSPSYERMLRSIKPDRHWERGNQPVDA